MGWQPSSGSMVCSSHFDPSEFCSRRLKYDAIPKLKKEEILADVNQGINAAKALIRCFDLEEENKKLKKENEKLRELRRNYYILHKRYLRLITRKRKLVNKVQDMKAQLNKSARSIIRKDDVLGSKIGDSDKVKQRFSAEVKNFAITLYSQSPIGYRSARSFFGNRLPHPRTLGRYKAEEKNIESAEIAVESITESTENNIEDIIEVSTENDIENIIEVSTENDIEDTMEVSTENDIENIIEVSTENDIENIIEVSTENSVENKIENLINNDEIDIIENDIKIELITMNE